MRLETFQMITSVQHFDAEAKILKAHALVPHESPVFEGHFPGFPLLPGVLMIESMAQTSGWLIMGLNGISAMPFLAGVKSAKMRSFVEPNTSLETQATLLHDGSGYAMTKAKIMREGKNIAEAELTFKVMPFPDAAFKAMVREWGKRLQFPLM